MITPKTTATWSIGLYCDCPQYKDSVRMIDTQIQEWNRANGRLK